MAITNYTNLQDALSRWLSRANASVTAAIPDFIALCEADMNQRLRIRAMETTLSATTTTTGQATVALPTRFLQQRSLRISSTSPASPLRYITPQQMDETKASTENGQPIFYTIEGDNYRFAKIPDGEYGLGGIYWQAFQALASVSVNWILTNAPDAYLYGSLVAAAPFIRHDQRMPTWMSLYSSAIKRIEDSDAKDRHGAGPLTVRSDTGNP